MRLGDRVIILKSKRLAYIRSVHTDGLLLVEYEDEAGTGALMHPFDVELVAEPSLFF